MAFFKSHRQKKIPLFLKFWLKKKITHLYISHQAIDIFLVICYIFLKVIISDGLGARNPGFRKCRGKMGLVEQGFSSTFAKILAKNKEKPCFDLP